MGDNVRAIVNDYVNITRLCDKPFKALPVPLVASERFDAVCVQVRLIVNVSAKYGSVGKILRPHMQTVSPVNTYLKQFDRLVAQVAHTHFVYLGKMQRRVV
jgi:hypothetical protein